MRAAEGLVRVVVHHVGAEIARPRDAEDRVHVRAVEIDQPAALVNQLRDLRHLPVEQAQRAGIGDHEHGDLVVELGRQILQIDHAVAALLLTVTKSKPAIRALAGLVPWALSGASTFVRGCF